MNSSISLSIKYLFNALILSILIVPIFSVGQQKASNSLPALTVSLIPVQRTEFINTFSANGNISAWQEAIIGSELNGLRLSHVLVNVGDNVKKGQLLADFAAESIEADLAQAKGSLAEAEALAKEAENNNERAHTLSDTGALSKQQLDQYATLADTAKARVAVNKAAVNSQQIRLRNTKIYAPDSGVISSRTATVGSVVSGSSELFRLIRQSRLEWRAEVISADLPKIKTGMQVKITAADGSSFNGKVRKISPTVDIQTRSTLVYVDLLSNHAKAGMFAKGDFVLGKSYALSVPQQALVMRDGFTYVFVVKNNHARQTKVQTGQRVGNSIQILNGLALNQMLVAKGGAFLSDNDLVKVIEKPSTSQ